jgi:hypothetical protein
MGDNLRDRIKNQSRSAVNNSPYAECIKLSGRSDVFRADIKRCDNNGLTLVTQKSIKQGTYLVVRIRHFSYEIFFRDNMYIRSTGLAEVRSVEEFINEKGLSYQMKLTYV